MPIYEYECKKCGAVYELLRRMSDDDTDIICPECGKKKQAKKLISSFSAGDSLPSGGSCGGSSGFT